MSYRWLRRASTGAIWWASCSLISHGADEASEGGVAPDVLPEAVMPTAQEVEAIRLFQAELDAGTVQTNPAVLVELIEGDLDSPTGENS